MSNFRIKKRSLLFAGIFLFCLSQEVHWVYGQGNPGGQGKPYTEVNWQEPDIKILDKNFEFAIGAKFLVNVKPISDAKNIQVRVFRGNREELRGNGGAENKDCVTFPSAVFDIENVNGHIEWGHVGPTWLALHENGELAKQEFFVRFEFKENSIPRGSFKFHKDAIEEYFGKKSAGFTITVVPLVDDGMPQDNQKKKWISEIKEWQKKVHEQKGTPGRRPSDCILFVKNQNDESVTVAKSFKCHELKTS